MLAEWCGARNGRRLVSAPPSISPATEAIIETSSSSSGASGGRMVGSRAASIDLPAPAGPTMSRLWPPAAATSSARLNHVRGTQVLARPQPKIRERDDALVDLKDIKGQESAWRAGSARPRR